jgi:hypothetical protein
VLGRAGSALVARTFQSGSTPDADETQGHPVDLCRNKKFMVLFVTNDADEAVILFDRVIVMRSEFRYAKS